MSEYTTTDIESAIQTGVIALVVVLGIPAAVYRRSSPSASGLDPEAVHFGLRGLLSAGMATGLVLGSSIVAALSIAALLLWYSR